MRLTWRQLKRKSKDMMFGGRGQIVNGGKKLLAAYKAISQKAKQRGCWSRDWSLGGPVCYQVKLL